MSGGTFFRIVMLGGALAGGAAITAPAAPSLPRALQCARSLGLQSRGTSVGGKRDVVVPINNSNGRGILFYADSGVHYVDLQSVPPRKFAIQFNAGDRRVRLLGERFEGNWLQFIPSDLPTSSPVRPFVLNATSVTNQEGARMILEKFLTDAIAVEQTRLSRLPATPDNIKHIQVFLKKTDACVDGVGYPLSHATRVAKQRLALSVLRGRRSTVPSSLPRQRLREETHD